jgi:hypothetical protein
MMKKTLNHNTFRIRHSQWERAEHEVNQLVDQLNKPIDPAIRTAVVAFRAEGFVTTASCEGHPKWGELFPWVDVDASPSGRPPSAPDFSDPTRRGTETRVRLNLKSQLRMLGILSAFYADRKVPIEQRLIIVPRGIFGAFQVVPQGGTVQKVLSRIKQKARLSSFRREFRDLAAYLRSRVG